MATTSKGYKLLAEVNIARAVLGLQPLGQLGLAESRRVQGPRALTSFLRCEVGPGINESWTSKLTLQLADLVTARAVATAVHQPFEADTNEVLATDAMTSFDIAAFYNVVIWDRDILRGWFEPADADPSVWDLHLMPGELYPPGHAPTGFQEILSDPWPGS